MKLKVFVILSFLFTLSCIASAGSMMDLVADSKTVSETGYYFLAEQERQGTDRFHNRLSEHGGLHEGSRQHCKPTPTPIPAAGWLFGTGIVGLYGVRRRMKK